EVDPVVSSALGGRATSAIETHPQGLALVAAAPVESEGTTVGVVLVGDVLDARFVGQVRRLTGLEVGFVGGGVGVGSLPDWSSGGLLAAIGDRDWLLVATRDQVFEERRVAAKQYRMALTPLPGLTGRPV